VLIHSYVLLDNHYHLVVETPAANLSQAMQWVNVSYSEWFNRRRGRVGYWAVGRGQWTGRSIARLWRRQPEKGWRRVPGSGSRRDWCWVNQFVERMRKLAQGNRQQQPALRALQRRCGMAEVIRCVEGMKGERWGSFRDRHRDWGRDVVLLLGRKLCGMKLRELAELAGVPNEATIALAVERVAARATKDAGLRTQIAMAQRQLLNVKT